MLIDLSWPNTWPNFTVVNNNSKISNIYHYIKAWKSIMNRCSIKKLFLKISQYSQESACVGVSSLMKMQTFSPAALFKKRLRHRCFPVNYAKFLRIPVLENISQRLFQRFPTNKIKKKTF